MNSPTPKLFFVLKLKTGTATPVPRQCLPKLTKPSLIKSTLFIPDGSFNSLFSPFSKRINLPVESVKQYLYCNDSATKLPSICTCHKCPSKFMGISLFLSHSPSSISLPINPSFSSGESNGASTEKVMYADLSSETCNTSAFLAAKTDLNGRVLKALSVSPICIQVSRILIPSLRSDNFMNLTLFQSEISSPCSV